MKRWWWLVLGLTQTLSCVGRIIEGNALWSALAAAAAAICFVVWLVEWTDNHRSSGVRR